MGCARLVHGGPGHLEPEKAAWSCLPRALMGSETKTGAGPGNACGPGIRIGLFYLCRPPPPGGGAGGPAPPGGAAPSGLLTGTEEIWGSQCRFLGLSDPQTLG